MERVRVMEWVRVKASVLAMVWVQVVAWVPGRV